CVILVSVRLLMFLADMFFIFSLFFFFFFSSRRRHTRFKCDWSSDVCSSDLLSENNSNDQEGVLFVAAYNGDNAAARKLMDSLNRSEERRVGKEGRSRWWKYHEKKNKRSEIRRKRIKTDTLKRIHRGVSKSIM